MNIRGAKKTDAAQLLEIYRPYVEQTAVSFELAAPSAEVFAGRIEKAVVGWAWLVAERSGQCVGYAYASSHRERPAYRFSVETSAYVHPAYQRQGVARALYAELFALLHAKGFCNAYAAITLPNEASLKLHQRVGFESLGVFESVGRKFGRWHDVAWLRRLVRVDPIED